MKPRKLVLKFTIQKTGVEYTIRLFMSLRYCQLNDKSTLCTPPVLSVNSGLTGQYPWVYGIDLTA